MSPTVGVDISVQTPHKPTRPLSVGLSKATTGFFWTTAGFGLVVAGVFVWLFTVWNDWANDIYASAEASDRVAAGFDTVFGLNALFNLGYLVTGILFIVWSFQAYKSAASRGAMNRRWSAGWTIGGWFIPFANYVIPKLVINEVDRMSNPAAGDPPIGGRWRHSPRLASSDLWWAFSVLALVLFTVGNVLTPALIEPESSYGTGILLSAIGMVAFAAAGVAGGWMVRTIGSRLRESEISTYAAHDSVSSPAAPVSDDVWIRGYDWFGMDEEVVRCLSCDEDVVFPTEQKRHNTHRIATGASPEPR